jgi:hypothetical protein
MVGLLLLSVACVLPVVYKVYFFQEKGGKAKKMMDSGSDEEGQ